MTEQTVPNHKLLQEGAIVAQFLESPSEHSFADLFKSTLHN